MTEHIIVAGATKTEPQMTMPEFEYDGLQIETKDRT
jgi:hypothetical protein